MSLPTYLRHIEVAIASESDPARALQLRAYMRAVEAVMEEELRLMPLEMAG
jgi:hypothetical protein